MIQIIYNIKEATTVKTFLQSQRYSKKSLSAIKQNGALLVNNHPVTVRAHISQDDILTVRLPEEIRSLYLKTSHIPIEILYDDSFLIIVNKPSYMNTIPSQIHPHDSLLEAVYGYLERNDDNSMLHPVSRLDRNTSGIVVFAKHQLIHHLLTNEIEKHYLLICHGELKVKGNICMPIERSDTSIITRQVSVYGQNSRTEYQLLQYNKPMHISLIRARLHTGRTHQIRVHFSALGHPLIGDTLYGNDNKIDRHALHAYEVRFNHPIYGNQINIKSSLPKDLSQFFDVL
ncbi:RluA family pseudouridine synthase [Macrococcoides bohemicum]|uniref:RluA family pseudouridine synthase n=1 Tax=Macrococcoides bohemicum TaxID=1903056 RepID=UPI003B00206B